MTTQKSHESWPIDNRRASIAAVSAFQNRGGVLDGLELTKTQEVSLLGRLANAVVCIANNAPLSDQAARLLPFDDPDAQFAYVAYDYAFGDDHYSADADELKRRKLSLAQIGTMAGCVEYAARADTQNGVLNEDQIASMRNVSTVFGSPRIGRSISTAVLRPLREELIDALIYNVWETKKYPVAIVGNPLSMTNRNSDVLAGMPYYYPPSVKGRKTRSAWKVANDAKTYSPTFSLHNPFLLVKRYDRENFRSLNIRANNQASRKPPRVARQYEIVDLERREDYFVADAARHFFIHAVRRKEALLSGIAKVADNRGKPIPDAGQEWLIESYGDFLTGADVLTGHYRHLREEYEAAVEDLADYEAYASHRLNFTGRG